MKEIGIIICTVLIFGVIMFMASRQEDDFQQCVDTASSRYPARTAPEGQPFKDVYRCMLESGYVQDMHGLNCANLDYTRAVMTESCYRSTNVIIGYGHDLKTMFR